MKSTFIKRRPNVAQLNGKLDFMMSQVNKEAAAVASAIVATELEVEVRAGNLATQELGRRPNARLSHISSPLLNSRPSFQAFGPIV